MPYRITEECNQCGACIPSCQDNAIKEGPDKNEIDVTICIECGLCMAICPFQAIVFEEDTESQ
jgi:ferredoxin